MTRIKGLMTLGAVCCWLVACGHGEQTGEWYPGQVNAPPATPAGAVVTGVGAVGASVPIPNVISTQVDPVGDGSTAVNITCKIPEPVAVHPMLLAGTDVWASTNEEQDKVCLGEGYALGEGFCRWVENHEARYRAIADCHRAALVELDRMGGDAVRKHPVVLEGGTWDDLKPLYVPAAWALTAEQAVADIGHFSGWVALLLDGTKAEVPANPFCFDKDRAATVREAKQATQSSLWWLYQTREAKQDWVIGSLTRGVNALVNPDVPAIQVSVNVVVTPPAPNSARCTFNLPPSSL